MYGKLFCSIVSFHFIIRLFSFSVFWYLFEYPTLQFLGHLLLSPLQKYERSILTSTKNSSTYKVQITDSNDPKYKDSIEKLGDSIDGNSNNIVEISSLNNKKVKIDDIKSLNRNIKDELPDESEMEITLVPDSGSNDKLNLKNMQVESAAIEGRKGKIFYVFFYISTIYSTAQGHLLEI